LKQSNPKYRRLWLLAMFCLLALSNCSDNLEHDALPDGTTGLLSLSVGGFQILPSFESNISEYKLELNEEVEQIILHAKSSSNATIMVNSQLFSGEEELEVTSGINQFEIQVIKNGEVRGYRLIITKIHHEDSLARDEGANDD